MVRESALWYQMLQFPCYNYYVKICVLSQASELPKAIVYGASALCRALCIYSKNHNIRLISHLSKATDALSSCSYFVDFHYVYENFVKKVRQCQKKCVYLHP